MYIPGRQNPLFQSPGSMHLLGNHKICGGCVHTWIECIDVYNKTHTKPLNKQALEERLCLLIHFALLLHLSLNSDCF